MPGGAVGCEVETGLRGVGGAGAEASLRGVRVGDGAGPNPVGLQVGAFSVYGGGEDFYLVPDGEGEGAGVGGVFEFVVVGCDQ
jgi:hypothetical protein